MEDRSSLETSDLLRAALQRAANIRSELVQLREQAFVASAKSQPAGSAADSQLAAAQVPEGGTPATLALPPVGDGGKPLVLPVILLPHGGEPERQSAAGSSTLSFLTVGGSSSNLPDALLHVGAATPRALPFGERGAAPKSSGGGGDTSLLSGGSWSIRAVPAAAREPATWQLGAAPAQLEGQTCTPAAAPAAAALLSPRDRSFTAVLAALQAEADQQQQQQQQQELAESAAFGAGAAGSLAACSSHSHDFPGDRHGQAGGSSSRSSSRQGTAAAAAASTPQRQYAQALLTFNRTDAERQLRNKLDQVNAAKRSHATRQRPSASSRSAALDGVPFLPPASPSKASSTAASQPSSIAGGAQLNHSQFVWHDAPMAAAPLLHSPVRGRRASKAGNRAACAEQEFGLNSLPFNERQTSLECRQASSTAAAEGSAGAAAQGSGRHSHVSLSDLLDSSSRGTVSATTGSALQTTSGLRQSSFSAVDAIRDAAIEQQAGAASRHAATSVTEAPAPAAASVVHPAAAEAAGEWEAVLPNAAVVPGEAAAPPMQDTPRQPGPVGRTQMHRDRGAADGGLVGRLLGRLASPMGQLQSPPATPDDAAASAAGAGADEAEDGEGCAVAVGTEASSTSFLSGVASIASSGSPDQRLASPVRVFPAEQQQQRQQHATPSAGASGIRLATAGSAASIGRKRSNSEVTLEDAPASVKKRSPEMGSKLLPRTSAEEGSSGALAAAALVAAAAGPPSPVTGLFAPPGECRDARQGEQVLQPSPPQHGQQLEHRQEEQQQPAGKGQRRASSAAPPATRRGPLAELQAMPSEPAVGSRVVVPVVLQHSPSRRRRQAAPPRVHAGAAAAQRAQVEQEASSSAPRDSAAPQVKPDSQPTESGSAAEPRPAATKSEEAAGGAGAPPVRQPRPVVPPLPLRRHAEGRPPGAPSLPVTTAAAAAVAAPEHELPSSSHWVPSPRGLDQQQLQPPAAPVQQRQGTPAPRHAQHRLAQGSPQLASKSVLVGRGPQAAAAACSPAASASPGTATDSPQPAVSPADLPASALAKRVAESAAAASPRILATPRRRLASLEPPTPRCQAAPCLQQDEHGKQLLAAAPNLAGMAGGALLDAMRQGTVVRKAWVRPNFQAGGSVRRMQLSPGGCGRAELLYPHGLFRKPLRFVVRRAVVNCPTWRPGAYIVLDTARGMLRLEPGSAAEYARWVLALNAAFLASGSGGSSADANGSRGGSDCRLVPVGSHRWSPAILFG